MPNDDATAFRRVELLPLGGLKANKRNPKAHDLDTIDASVSRFGVIDPIVLDSRTGTIISGHGRAAALRAMKQRGESPPDGVQETSGGEWLVPVATGWSSRTDTEANAALIALNRTTELGGWVDEQLLELLGDLSELGDDAFSGVGFGSDDMDDLRARLGGAGVPGPEGGFPGSVDVGLEPGPDSYKEQYGLNLVFPSQEEQERAYEHLVSLGYEVRVVVV